MSWHQVVIPNVGGAVEFGHDIIRQFIARYKEAGRPAEVAVRHARNHAGDHLYYFSPAAVALAPEVLRAYNATACAEPPRVEGLRRVPLEDV
jgi:hypothetical protein